MARMADIIMYTYIKVVQLLRAYQISYFTYLLLWFRLILKENKIF